MAVSINGWICTGCQSSQDWEADPRYFPRGALCTKCNALHSNFKDCPTCANNDWGNFNSSTAECLKCGYINRIGEMNTFSIIPYIHVPILSPEPKTPVILNRCPTCGIELCPGIDDYYGLSPIEAAKCVKCRF